MPVANVGELLDDDRAVLTLYDMCKAVDKTMSIEGVRVTLKTKQ